MTQQTSLTFRVRDGLVVHRDRIVTEQRLRQTVRRAERQSFGAAFGAELVDLLPSELRLYAHALEPAPIETDEAGRPIPASVERHKAAAAALAELHHRPASAPADELPAHEARVVTATVTAVLEALRVSGVLPSKK